MASGTIRKQSSSLNVIELSNTQSISSNAVGYFTFQQPEGYAAVGSVGYYLEGSGNTQMRVVKITADSAILQSNYGATASITIHNYVLVQPV